MSVTVCLTDFKVCFISLHSLGVALSRGHGKYFFRGNVTVEEGKMPTFACHLHSSFSIDLVDLKFVCLPGDSIRQFIFFFFFSVEIFFFMRFIFPLFILNIVRLCIFFRWGSSSILPSQHSIATLRVEC